jgi:hypothetical protein
MDIKHILASGCSLSQNGIGGVPPTKLSSGGCSFNNGADSSDPASWVGFVAKSLNVSSLVNTAASGHGNILIANSIIEMLTRYQYDYKTTLVLFNITWPSRLDIPCDFDHPDHSKHIPWTCNLIPYTYLKMDSTPAQYCYKHMGAEQVEQISCLSLINLFNFLENNQFNYRFVVAKDFSNFKTFDSVIKSRKENLIVLDNKSPGVVEFVTDNNLKIDSIHPTVEGHRIISKIILNHIQEM